MNRTTGFNLNANGLTVAEVCRNLAPSSLYEHAIRFEKNFATYAAGARAEVKAAALLPNE